MERHVIRKRLVFFTRCLPSRQWREECCQQYLGVCSNAMSDTYLLPFCHYYGIKAFYFHVEFPGYWKKSFCPIRSFQNICSKEIRHQHSVRHWNIFHYPYKGAGAQ